jgi:uncharacterized oxidoreductase
MILTGNTILITGGGTGIGRGLAEALHAKGNQVIITGRREAPLKETCAANPGMSFAVFDASDADGIRSFSAQIIKDHPKLNGVVANAGIMSEENLLADEVDVSISEAIITTNLLGPICLIAALLPHLRAQAHAAIVTVSSGLAFVPRASAPTYNATKAAIHSYSQSLRYQLRKTAVEVIEIAPPLVATDIIPSAKTDSRALPLDAFISEVMSLLSATPALPEIYVERVKLMRNAEVEGRYATVFDMLNPPDA